MPKHVVVDGSNIATEGRNAPSLAQLSAAVDAFMSEFPGTKVTVVVDATFGHRINKKEVKEFEAAIDNNELVAPPAGAVGRGDAFVLSIAKKVGASVLSNDSYQEFHGQHTWLFDEGRLIGGKPVPNVGWVFVNRVPVRGSVSRRAQREGKDGPVAVSRTPSKEASRPMPVPKAPPPKVTEKPKSDKTKPAEKSKPAKTDEQVAKKAKKASKKKAKKAAMSGAPVNELLPFLGFVEKHKVGSKVKGVVDSYSAHGAFVKLGDVQGYWPMRLMSSPPPRRPRDIAAIGAKVELVVAGFTPARRGIDVGIVDLVKVQPELKSSASQSPKPAKAAPAKKSAAIKSTPRKASAKVVAKAVTAKKSPAKKVVAKKVVKKTVAKATATKPSKKK